jgi:hypothetical protein
MLDDRKVLQFEPELAAALSTWNIHASLTQSERMRKALKAAKDVELSRLPSSMLRAQLSVAYQENNRLRQEIEKLRRIDIAVETGEWPHVPPQR